MGKGLHILVLACSASVAACVPVKETHWEPVPRAQSALSSNSLQKIAPGSIVRVRTKKDRVLVFRVTKLEPDAFWGTARNGTDYRVPYSALAALELRVDETVWREVRLFPGGYVPLP